MSRVPVLVLRTAGINCDEETMYAWRLAGADPALVHVNRLAENPGMIDDHAILTIPGGFSYGDDIAAGSILAQRLACGLTDRLSAFVDRGGGILGICNGFQVLVKAGLLPGGPDGRAKVTVTYNDSAKFEARWVRLEVSTDRCPFLARVLATRSNTEDGEGVKPHRQSSAEPTRNPTRPRDSDGVEDDPHREDDALNCDGTNTAHAASRGLKPAAQVGAPNPTHLEMPVEHAEGKVVVADGGVLDKLTAGGFVALRYVDADGQTDVYPANPNGSDGGIAGLCDATGRIFGLMPHPDRAFEHTHHPHWTRRQSDGPPDGLVVFQNAVAHWS